MIPMRFRVVLAVCAFVFVVSVALVVWPRHRDHEEQEKEQITCLERRVDRVERVLRGDGGAFSHLGEC